MITQSQEYLVKSSMATVLRRPKSNLETWVLNKESEYLFLDLGKALCTPEHIPVTTAGPCPCQKRPSLPDEGNGVDTNMASEFGSLKMRSCDFHSQLFSFLLKISFIPVKSSAMKETVDHALAHQLFPADALSKQR